MIPLFTVNMSDAVDAAVIETLHSGYVTEGPRVKAFEQALGEWCGTPHVAVVNSGTSALTLALRVAGVCTGAEVVTTPMTCAATNLPILTLGATPVWADVDPATGLIDPDDARRKITPRTKAVMAVDWGGAPVGRLDMPVPVIEDAAHAIGGVHDGGRVGAINTMTCFSFQAIKHLTTVDGGALSSVHPEYIQRAKLLRWFGIDREAPVQGDSRIDVDILEPGYKMHMNDVAATIGLTQLGTLDRILQKHRSVAARYDAELNWQYQRPPSAGNAYWMYTLLLPQHGMQQSFRDHMAERGVQVSKVHRRNDDYGVFAPYRGGELPGLDEFYGRMMCLPVHTRLSEDDQQRVVAAANEFVRAGAS